MSDQLAAGAETGRIRKAGWAVIRGWNSGGKIVNGLPRVLSGKIGATTSCA